MMTKRMNRYVVVLAATAAAWSLAGATATADVATAAAMAMPPRSSSICIVMSR